MTTIRAIAERSRGSWTSFQHDIDAGFICIYHLIKLVSTLMSPRAYKVEKRRAAAEQTRTRVLESARELIMASPVPPSIDAVAAHAGVARMTVYYQFGSKAGLLEALFDELGGRYFRSELPLVMSQDEPLQALADLIEVFLTFWASERLVTRRIRGMATLDSDFEESLRGRDKRRRLLIRTVL